MPKDYRVNLTFNVYDLIPFTGGLDDEEKPSNLRSNPSQNEGDDGRPQAKGPTTRTMTRRIQDMASTDLSRPRYS